MLQNAYFLAKIGADTAENEQHFAEILPKTGNYPERRAAARGALQGLLPELGAACRDRSGGLELLLVGAYVFSNSELYWQICKIWQIFSGLVPGCIKTKFCKKICV